MGYAYRRRTAQQGAGEPGDDSMVLPIELNPNVNTKGFHTGVRSGDGDGTVPLVSLGLMCAHKHLWNGTSAYNPAGIRVSTREFVHDPLRGLDVFRPLQNAP